MYDCKYCAAVFKISFTPQDVFLYKDKNSRLQNKTRKNTFFLYNAAKFLQGNIKPRVSKLYLLKLCIK